MQGIGRCTYPTVVSGKASVEHLAASTPAAPTASELMPERWQLGPAQANLTGRRSGSPVAERGLWRKIQAGRRERALLRLTGRAEEDVTPPSPRKPFGAKFQYTECPQSRQIPPTSWGRKR